MIFFDIDPDIFIQGMLLLYSSYNCFAFILCSKSVVLIDISKGWSLFLILRVVVGIELVLCKCSCGGGLLLDACHLSTPRFF